MAIDQVATVLSIRGELMIANNIKARLNMPDVMETMSFSGEDIGEPAAMSQKNRQNFANQLDKLLLP